MIPKSRKRAKGHLLPIRFRNTRLLLVALGFIFSSAATAQVASARVKGLVEDESGQPLEGITIAMKEPGKDSARNTVTNGKGMFEFTLKEKGNYTFTASGIGFAEQVLTRRNVDLSKDEALLFVMKPLAASLNDVVVVGYGKQKRKDITGAVVKVPESRFEKVPNLNIAQVIQGAIPGVMIQQTQAGAASQESILIRGRNSILASNAPLIVLDGAPYSGQLRDINVNDIASMEVLKDASAAAIYGSRGSNGVIIVSTKAGVKGKTQITYDGRTSFQQYTKLPETMSATEFYAFKEIREPGKLTTTELDNYNEGKFVNWADLALREGRAQQHNLSTSGAIGQANFYIGGGVLDVKGLSVTDQYKRYSGRINLDVKVTPWLLLGSRNQFTFENQDGAAIDYNLVFRKNPLINPYDPSGNVSIYPWPEFQDIRNPLEPINILDKDRSFQLVTNNFAELNFPFLEGLSYRLNTGVRRKYADAASYAGRNTKLGLEARGVANTSEFREVNDLVEHILSYNRRFSKHNIFATLLYSYERNQFTGNSLQGQGFSNDFLTWYAMAQAEQLVPEYNFSRTVLLSQMARLNYGFDDRYLFTFTGRRDGFSGFGAATKWGFFPSLAAAWNISNENFFQSASFVQLLKLRVSYGLNGNQAVNAYESISRLGEENTVAGSQTQPGFVPIKLGQDNLGWETTRSLNAGLDFAVFNERLSGTVNMFRSNTEDLLLNRTISSVQGISSITQNIGKTRNTGLELQLNAQLFKSKHLSWSAFGNFSTVRNRIVALYGQLNENGTELDDLVNAWFIGKPILVNYDYAWAGVWQTHEAQEAAAWGSKPGYVKLLDADANGKLTGDDRQVIGQQDPKFSWGFGNTVRWKALQLDFFLYGMHGMTRVNGQMADAPVSSEVRRNTIRKNWWTDQNPTNEWYKNEVNANIMGGISSSVYENAGFMRVKDITVSYDLPAPLLSSAGMRQCRAYFSARNQFTFTQWRGMDPELLDGRGAIPLQKKWVLGLTIGL